jgi:hypothetical protein
MAPVAAAVLPHPPLLVPELAGAAAAPELAPLRAACQEALSAVVGAADLTIVIGDGPVWAVPTPSAPGSFHPYGADVDVTLPTLVDLDLGGLPPPAQLTDLPLSLAIAAYLLEDLDPPPTQLFAAAVPRSLGPRAAATIGRTLATTARFDLVVMADLSACRTDRAPGGFRPQAADLDAQVADAFRTGTPQRLLTLDPTRSADLLLTGRAPLQVLAGAFDRGPSMGDDAPARGGAEQGTIDLAADDEVLDETGSGVRGRVLYEDAPYGVGYLVALLTNSMTTP